MSLRRVGLLAALLAGIALAFSSLTHVAAGRSGAAVLAAASGLAVAAGAALVLDRIGGPG